MTFEDSARAQPLDRRVRRSRTALMRAAVELVTERGTAAVSVTDIAETADVSRQVLYQQFGDRDGLLLAAALELVRAELPPVMDGGDGDVRVDRTRMLAAIEHFAEHRVFYRALLTSASGFALTQELQAFFLPYFKRGFEHQFGGRLDADTIDNLARFVDAGVAMTTNLWLLDAEDPLDPGECTDRIMQAIAVLAPAAT